MADKVSKAKALWGEARRSAAKAKDAAVESIDTRTGDRASKTLATGSDSVRVVKTKTQDLTKTAVEAAAGTKIGATGLERAEEGFTFLGGLPGFTAIGDTVQSRQGISRLVQRLQEDPFDPMPPVWLAEAFLRAQREQGGVNAVRAVANPVRIAVQGVASAVKHAGKEQTAVPATTQLLGRAYVLALTHLDENLETHELHALSRVYLARGAPTEAVRLAQGAIACEGSGTAEAAVTLARAHAQRGALALASDSARLAVDLGSTVGHQLLAELPATGDDEGGSLSTDERADLLSMVELEDVVRYRGAAPTAREMASDVYERQRQRLKSQGPKLRAATESLKGRFGAEEADRV